MEVKEHLIGNVALMSITFNIPNPAFENIANIRESRLPEIAFMCKGKKIKRKAQIFGCGFPLFSQAFPKSMFDELPQL